MSNKEGLAEGRVRGKVAVVTGAGSGIGRAAALRLAEQGAKLVLVDLIDARSKEVEEEISRTGGEAFFADTDVSDPARVEHAMKQAAEKYGRIDILFANAGVNGTLAPIEHLDPEDWDRTLGINLKGTFLATKYALPHMKKNGGSIVITSSINGSRKFTGFGMSAYSSSKAGQVAFAKMAALELAQFGIRVNAICPGAIRTNIGENTNTTPEVKEITIPVEYPKGNQPLEHGPGEPEQVADLVLFLASEESSHISGTAIYIDGVESLL
ncbi:SDR family NAD(P)-dependent oxidoreductase [Paenibacillus sp. LHD-117]|uniref:SDR family oxidoreductase n=1 Tax=Paenibacillus sp. LHD-117 TaxID=3071412 RepID=UPI0027E0E3FB|nr:SDR family NAD(P)-dependent oxidoreductase [Paenibacillus sp. LHD-117]MDQ6421536.1 SDR family NAD(P)-dependent oxidoreductase [Paenibacillus sp. LHD-117]